MSMDTIGTTVFGVRINPDPKSYDKERLCAWVRRHEGSIFAKEDEGFEVPDDDDELLGIIFDYEGFDFSCNGVASAFCSVVNRESGKIFITDYYDDGGDPACGIAAAELFPWDMPAHARDWFEGATKNISSMEEAREIIDSFADELSECSDSMRPMCQIQYVSCFC